MTHEASLFDATDEVEALWERCGGGDQPPSLLGTQAAKLPEHIQPAAKALQAHLLKAAFERLAGASLKAADAGGPAPRPSIILHSASMEVFSKCSSLEYFPWHLTNEQVRRDLAAEIGASLSLAPLEALAKRTKAANVFIASQSKDDRASYLRGVKAIIDSHPVHRLVLDAEMVNLSWGSQIDEISRELGMSAYFLGASSVHEARTHSDLVPAQGRSVVLCDTAGKNLAPGGQDKVVRAPQRPAATRTEDLPSVGEASDSEMHSDSQTTGGPMASRLQQIRARQALARRPAAARPA
ncbi:MAG: hypothetical protein O9327_05030 [Polaromonas sp.]|nr:hypothetical protein [Polaromonas sp.]